MLGEARNNFLAAQLERKRLRRQAQTQGQLAVRTEHARQHQQQQQPQPPQPPQEQQQQQQQQQQARSLIGQSPASAAPAKQRMLQQEEEGAAGAGSEGKGGGSRGGGAGGAPAAAAGGGRKTGRKGTARTRRGKEGSKQLQAGTPPRLSGAEALREEARLKVKAARALRERNEQMAALAAQTHKKLEEAAKQASKRRAIETMRALEARFRRAKAGLGIADEADLKRVAAQFLHICAEIDAGLATGAIWASADSEQPQSPERCGGGGTIGGTGGGTGGSTGGSTAESYGIAAITGPGGMGGARATDDTAAGARPQAARWPAQRPKSTAVDADAHFAAQDAYRRQQHGQQHGQQLRGRVRGLAESRAESRAAAAVAMARPSASAAARANVGPNGGGVHAPQEGPAALQQLLALQHGFSRAVEPPRNQPQPLALSGGDAWQRGMPPPPSSVELAIQRAAERQRDLSAMYEY